MPSWTFLIPHAGNYPMLEACLDSIRRHHYLQPILLNQHVNDNPDRAKELAARYGAKLIWHNQWWPEACRDLFAACPTRYAIYMEADCILLDPLFDLMAEVEEGTDFLGVEEVIPLAEGFAHHRPDWLRYQPGYYSHSFFMLNMGRFIEEFGPDGIWIDYEAASDIPDDREREPIYGISQKIRGWPQRSLAVRLASYGFPTVYEEKVFHFWFGSWRVRGDLRAACGVDTDLIARTEGQVLEDYWEEKLCA